MTSWRNRSDHRMWLQGQCVRQLAFGRAFPHPDGGAAWLDATGAPDLTMPTFTYATARMVHVYSLGALAGVPGCRSLAGRALDGLTGRLHDDEHGGWFASAGPGPELDGAKLAYAHAFVLLAASSATVAGLPGAREVLDDVDAVLEARFRDPARGLLVDRWDRAWSRCDPYRGVNANMHGVEAALAAFDATQDPRFLAQAAGVAEQVVQVWAAAHDWRVPEHFDEGWQPRPDHHRDQPDHPFEPFGATIGHGLEWARLVVSLRAALGAAAPDWMLPAAESLFARAVQDGWHVDGVEGFVYTTDWQGAPVVRERMHWVVAEAICAAAALHEATGSTAYDALYHRWWDHAATYWVDSENGSWQHQLAPDLTPSQTVWAGRPDLYHSLHAVLLPRLPLHPGAALALTES